MTHHISIPIRLITSTAVLVLGLFLTSCVDRESRWFKDEAKKNEDRETASTERLIQASKPLQELEAVCRALPYFRDTVPLTKATNKEANKLFYNYRLNQAVDTVNDAVKRYFADQGWTLKREDDGFWEYQIEFEKGNYSIQVTSGNFGESNFATNCHDRRL